MSKCEGKSKMEWKPMRPSALIMAGLGTAQVLAVMGVHLALVLWGSPVDATTANPGVPETVLASSVVGFLMLLGGAITKLCEDAPAPEAGEDPEITKYRLQLEDKRLSGSPDATVEMTEETLKHLPSK